MKSLPPVLNALWTAFVGLVALIWNLATEGLKMILNTLKEIPPVIIGLISASLLCWMGLTLLTSSEIILTIFAITLCLLALGALGMAFLQKWFDHQKALQTTLWEQEKAREVQESTRESLIQDQLQTFQKVLHLMEKVPVESPENIAKLETAATNTFLSILGQINDTAALPGTNEADRASQPAAPAKGKR